MKNFIKRKLSNILKKFENKKHSSLKKRIVREIQTYFEGYECGGYTPHESFRIPAVVNMPVSKLGVHKFSFSFKKKLITVNVFLERPGLFIGKQGSTINGIEKHLSTNDYRVQIKLTEIKSPWF
jgi:ribosomal protein S3